MTDEDLVPVPPRPALRIVHGGEPTPAETAALVAAVAARAAAAAAPTAAPPRSAAGWAARGAALRHPPTPGPGAWVASARPQR
ncbi:MAG TPA: acyl-CoA carboxylase epsilon subunit [Mycobacteriales bacterium]|nr:acyl-CoA carboxylase epsilon subunit [Mycobacteriales bacterium]